MSEKKEHQKTKVNYGYYIDEDGLFYYSEINGETFQCFDINGVASTTYDFGIDFELLELAYIYEKDDGYRDDELY
jgi:hypothetical protein